MSTLFPDKAFEIYTDGGSRGNPGPAAIGAVVGGKEYGEYIGTTTNNVAEYKAVIFALRKAKALLGKAQAKKIEVIVNVDSELIYKQVGREYKVLDDDLKILFVDVLNLMMDFKDVKFRHVRREKNKKADRLVNEALNKQ